MEASPVCVTRNPIIRNTVLKGVYLYVLTFNRVILGMVFVISLDYTNTQDYT